MWSQVAILINSVVIRCCRIADIVLLNSDVVGIPVMCVTSGERWHIVMVGSVRLRIRTIRSVVGLYPQYAIRYPISH